jgi:hypothetical protein
VAKRGYNRDTIRGGASDWDVSRPFSSALKLGGRILFHPIRFFEVLPRIGDVRAPALFLAFAGLVSAVLWLVLDGPLSAILALLLTLPVSFALALPYHLASTGGRHGYPITWRVLAYPFGYAAPFLAVPGLRWVAAAYAGLVLMPIGLSVVREIGAARSLLACLPITGLLLLAAHRFL